MSVIKRRLWGLAARCSVLSAACSADRHVALSCSQVVAHRHRLTLQRVVFSQVAAAVAEATQDTPPPSGTSFKDARGGGVPGLGSYPAELPADEPSMVARAQDILIVLGGPQMQLDQTRVSSRRSLLQTRDGSAGAACSTAMACKMYPIEHASGPVHVRSSGPRS